MSEIVQPKLHWILILLHLSSFLANGFQLSPHQRRYQVAETGLFSSAKRDLNPTNNNEELLNQLEKEFDYKGRIHKPSNPNHRCGYISLIGAPNMGKSTLLNALLQEQLCTATHRPQTTRHSILGVLSTPDCQLCFLDTPGVIEDPAYKLQEGMMEAVKGAFTDSDVLLIVTDLFSTPIPDDELFQKLILTDRKKIVVVNKIDLADKVNPNGNQKEFHEKNGQEGMEDLYRRTITVAEAVQNWRQLIPDALAIIPMNAEEGGDNLGVCALRSLLTGGPDVPKAFRDLGRPVPGMFLSGVKTISDEEAKTLIPLGPALYDTDTLTDRSERFFASEIIRATLFTSLGKELPYCCEVRIDQFREPKEKDKSPITRIEASIYVERDSQKGIVVGKGGSKVKEVGVESRRKLEDFLQGKVHLQLNVKVDKNWRRDEKRLKEYGYLK